MTYPTKRQRLLNEIRKYHVMAIDPCDAFVKAEKQIKIIKELTRRLNETKILNQIKEN